MKGSGKFTEFCPIYRKGGPVDFFLFRHLCDDENDKKPILKGQNVSKFYKTKSSKCKIAQRIQKQSIPSKKDLAYQTYDNTSTIPS